MTILKLDHRGNAQDILNEMLSQIEQHGTDTTELDISYNLLGKKKLSFLSTSLQQLSELKVLNIAGNGLSSEDISVIVNVLKSLPKLEKLDISDNHNLDASFIKICQCLAEKNSFQSLVATRNSLVNIKPIATLISQNPNLEKIDISDNSIRYGFDELATQLVRPESSVRMLDIRNNIRTQDKLYPLSIKFLSAIIENSQQLKEFDIRGSVKHRDAEKIILKGNPCQLDVLYDAITTQDTKKGEITAHNNENNISLKL